ncbi:hypothetical protein, partial [Agrobacterium sp. 22-226-1]
NCDAFIVFRSFPSQENAPENSNQKRSSLKGSDQVQIINIVTLFEPQECANYFKSCGYDPE